MRRFFVAVVVITLGLSPLAHAGNWGHWRGPTGNGTAIEGNPPTEWSTTKNVKWKVEIPGRGSSSPVVWDNRVFVTTAVPVDAKARNGELDYEVLCFDRNTGKLLWKKSATIAKPHEKTHETNGYASASPCTDGSHVYAHFGSRGLYCYTMDGEFVWKRDDLGNMTIRTALGREVLRPWLARRSLSPGTTKANRPCMHR